MTFQFNFENYKMGQQKMVEQAFQRLKHCVLNDISLSPDELKNIRNYLLTDKEQNKIDLTRDLESTFTKHGTRSGTLLNFVSDAQSWNFEILELILDCGADPFGIEDESGQTSLHRAIAHGCYCNSCNDKAAKCVKILLERSTKYSKILVDTQDKFGDTALHLAARNLFPKAAAVMLDFDADIFIMNSEQSLSKPQEYVLTTIVQTIPSVLLVKLDRAVGEQTNQSVLHKKLMSNAKISDYEVSLKGNRYNSTNMTLRIDMSFLTQKKRRQVDPDLDGNIFERGREIDFLVSILKAHKTAREKLFEHPVTTAFLDKKWKKVRWCFMASRSIFLAGACFYTDFTFNYYLQNCPYRYDEDDGNVNSTVTVTEPDKNKCDPFWNSHLYGWLLMCFTGLMIFNQVITIGTQRWEYLNQKSWNLAWWLLIIGVGCTSFTPIIHFYPFNWMHTLAAITVFWFWTMLLATFTRIPRVAVYIQMLIKVIKTVLFCVWVYGAIVLGFGFGFHVMFPENQQFKNPVLSFVKLLLMMLGDADYEGILQDNKAEDEFFTIPAHIFYSGFLVLVTIVFMNLLVGLSVSDIQLMMATSRMAGIAGQVGAIDTLERQIFSSWIARCYQACGLTKLNHWIQDTFSVVSPHDQYLKFQPYNPKDLIIEKKLQFKLLNLYKNTFHRHFNNLGHIFASPKLTHELLDDRLKEVFKD